MVLLNTERTGLASRGHARRVLSYDIAPGQGRVWVAPQSSWRLSGAALSGAALPEAVLSEAERARMARLHFARDRQLFAAAHVLVRQALSQCAPQVAPQTWQFVVSAHGRPELAPPRDRLRFNLSHTDGLVACVVTLDLDCGIDVEAVRPRSAGAVSRRVLAPTEQAVVASAPANQRPLLFLRFWTLKEAYSKARGLGMSLPLEQCEFSLGDGVPRLVAHPADPHPDPDGWRFIQYAPTGGHVLAVALRTGTAPWVSSAS